MKTRIDELAPRHMKGYNCAQALACTYADLVGIDEETMFKITEGLGGGMGSMEGTCGAVAAACILAGLKNSTANLEAPNSKGSTTKLSREILNEFKNKNGSVTCKELKGALTGKPLRSCPGCIEDAAVFVEKIIFEIGK